MDRVRDAWLWLGDTAWPCIRTLCGAVADFCVGWWDGVDLHPGLHAASAVLGALIYHVIRVYG
jgi:hypothetical protein